MNFGTIITNIRVNNSIADDFNTDRGTVKSREALLPRSLEVYPLIFELFDTLAVLNPPPTSTTPLSPIPLPINPHPPLIHPPPQTHTPGSNTGSCARQPAARNPLSRPPFRPPPGSIRPATPLRTTPAYLNTLNPHSHTAALLAHHNPPLPIPYNLPSTHITHEPTFKFRIDYSLPPPPLNQPHLPLTQHTSPRTPGTYQRPLPLLYSRATLYYPLPRPP